LSNKTSSFIGAYCTDIYPSTGYTGDGSIKDNYLNMYLSQTYSNTSNYIIFKSDSFWNGNLTEFNEIVPRTLKNVKMKGFHIKYDYTELGFVIGYYIDEKDSKQYAMVIGNLTLRPYQFTQANVSNSDFDGHSVGIMIESRKIDEAIARIFSHFK
jgi:hypothetical protein